MNADSIKKTVVRSYGQLAKATQHSLYAKIFGCCDPAENREEVGKKIGYSQTDLTSVPVESNLGVGCGNPSALAKIEEGHVVVDLGSGAGFDAFLVARQVGGTGKVIGIDLSQDMLKLAKKNARKGKYTNVEFIEGDIEHLPLGEGIADCIISNCVINLSLRKDAVFKEAYRVLKFGGRLAISDIVLEKELPAFAQDSVAAHVACVSGAEKLEDYLEHIRKAGFSNIRVENKKAFPLELMMTDPQLKSIAEKIEFTINKEELKDLAAHVISISISAMKA